MDSDDDTLHPPKRKRLRVLEDDLVCSEVYSNTSTCTTASTCTAASTCMTAYQADTESRFERIYSSWRGVHPFTRPISTSY